MIGTRIARRRSLLVAAPLLSIATTLAGLALCIEWGLHLSPVDLDDPARVVVIRSVDSDGQRSRG